MNTWWDISWDIRSPLPRPILVTRQLRSDLPPQVQIQSDEPSFPLTKGSTRESIMTLPTSSKGESHEDALQQQQAEKLVLPALVNQHVTQRQLDERLDALKNDSMWRDLDHECLEILQLSVNDVQKLEKRKGNDRVHGPAVDEAMATFDARIEAAETRFRQALEPSIAAISTASSSSIVNQYCTALVNTIESKKQALLQAVSAMQEEKEAKETEVLTIAEEVPKRKKQRMCLSSSSKSMLRKWFDEHFHHPYPSEEEKQALSQQTGITMDQVNNWFINTRVRAWKPKVKAIIAGNSTELDAVLDKMQAPFLKN